jgi:hypothetical protein
MIDKNIRFEKQGNLHKLFYNNGSKEYDMGISFMTNHNIEDYPITILEEINGRDCYLSPCKNVVIKLLNPPEKTEKIEIARDAGIEFAGDFVLGIENLLLSADAVYARNVNFGLVGALEIVNRGTKSGEGCKISISDTQIERPDYLEREDAAILEADCKYLQIDTSAKLLIFGENRIECLGGKVVIDNTGDNLHDAICFDNAKLFIPENAEAVIRRIEGKDSSLTLAQSEDNKYFIKRAYLVNSEAKNISGDIYLYAENSKINGMTFEENSGVVLTTNAPHDNGITNFIVENILLKKDSSLEARDNQGKDASIKLGNIVVEGEATLASNSDYIMESSILGKGTTSLTSGSEELKILNSILQGNNTIGKVTSITNSKIENSIIIAANAKIEDTELVNVANYKAYIQPKVEDISIITNEIEKL